MVTSILYKTGSIPDHLYKSELEIITKTMTKKNYKFWSGMHDEEGNPVDILFSRLGINDEIEHIGFARSIKPESGLEIGYGISIITGENSFEAVDIGLININYNQDFESFEDILNTKLPEVLEHIKKEMDTFHLAGNNIEIHTEPSYSQIKRDHKIITPIYSEYVGTREKFFNT